MGERVSAGGQGGVPSAGRAGATPTAPPPPVLNLRSPGRARRHAEVGASSAILDAGYNLDSLLLRYQGVDWRDRATWGCNGA